MTSKENKNCIVGIIEAFWENSITLKRVLDLTWLYAVHQCAQLSADPK